MTANISIEFARRFRFPPSVLFFLALLNIFFFYFYFLLFFLYRFIFIIKSTSVARLPFCINEPRNGCNKFRRIQAGGLPGRREEGRLSEIEASDNVRGNKKEKEKKKGEKEVLWLQQLSQRGRVRRRRVEGCFLTKIIIIDREEEKKRGKEKKKKKEE